MTVATSRNILALVLYTPCDSSCRGVPAGQTVTVPMTAINGYSSVTTEVQVIYWLFFPGPNDRVDSSAQSATVRIR